MMPSATTNLKQTMKPKIGFSIESIVGGGVRKRSSDSIEESEDGSNNMPNSPKLPTSENLNNNNNFNELIKRARRCESSNTETQTRLSRESSSDHDNQNNNHKLINNNYNGDNKILRHDSQSRSPSPVTQKAPILVPGIPAGLIRPPILGPHGHYPPDSHNPHLLAQFQALANVQAAQVGFNSGHLPQHLPPHLHNPNLSNLPRESYPLYPWLLSRHGRLFPHRFPGSE